MKCNWVHMMLAAALLAVNSGPAFGFGRGGGGQRRAELLMLLCR
jgi:hypothetical protein